MHEAPLSKVQFDFPGITVLVPMISEIVAVDLGSTVTINFPKPTDDFIMIRYIANIALYSMKDYDHLNPLQNFDPPIKIRVGYNCYDVMKCNGDIHQLKLAYLNNGSQWEIISDLDHDYHILPSSTAPVAEVTIWSWTPDTPVAWGK